MATVPPRRAQPGLPTPSAPRSQTREALKESLTRASKTDDSADQDAAVQEQVAQPVPTGDLHLSLNRSTPSTKYLDNLRMDRLLEKLTFLDYTTVLRGGFGGKGLPRDYFLAEKSEYVGRRFHTFGTLCYFMFGIMGVEMKEPQERDDPNLVVAAILDGLKKLSISVEMTAYRLKTGAGSGAVAVLYELATLALHKRTLELQQPEFPKSSQPSDDVGEDGEDGEDEDEFRAIPEFDWDQEDIAEEILEDGEFDGNRKTTAEASEKMRAAEEWLLEADRIAPFFNRPDGDRLSWADRIHKLDLCRTELEQNVENVFEKLAIVTAEITRTASKIQSREKYISVNHRDKVEKYRIASSKLASAKAQYEAHNSEVEVNAKKLVEVTAEFEKLKRRVEDKGNNMGDRVTINSMKAAMKRMKEEIGMYNIKSAIAELHLQELQEKIQNAEVEESIAEISTIGIIPVVRKM